MTGTVNINNSEHITKIVEFNYLGELIENKAKFGIGLYKDLVIIKSQSIFAQDKSKYTVPAEFTEQQKLVYQRSIDRNFWSIDIFFNFANLDKVIERIEICLGLKEPVEEININEFDITTHNDQMAVRFNQIAPMNKSEPIITLQLINLRHATLDFIESDSWELWVSPQTGEVLLKELRKISSQAKTA